MIVEASRAYSRGLIRGVARFQCEHQKWLLDYTTRGLDDPLPGWLSRWHGDGILARLNSRKMAKAVARRGVPVIDLRRAFSDLGLPSIGPDGSEIARIAYEHLRERGFTNFGFFGPPEGVHHELDQRAVSFLRYVREAGFVCDMFQSRSFRGGAGDSAPGPGTPKQILPFDGLMLELRRASAMQWDRKLQSVVRWIRRLPKPVGVMVGNDDYGMLLINACRSAKVQIPEEVAIIG
ncbi:MAG: substrate-binding domain-containing protein, partial [Pirellulaceae bacterium]|nr:substrate-binding domain-containing protein [Pirellulaceae bacterium]